MYKKIFEVYLKKSFGNRIVGFTNKKNYFLVIRDRGETAYFFIDYELKKIYPANSFINEYGFNYRFEKSENFINEEFNFDFSKYGFSSCPKEYVELIIDSSKNNSC